MSQTIVGCFCQQEIKIKQTQLLIFWSGYVCNIFGEETATLKWSVYSTGSLLWIASEL